MADDNRLTDMAKRKKPSSSFSRLIAGLDDFILHRMGRPLWILAWMLFVGAVCFIVTFYISAGETQASIDRDTTAIEIKTNETIEVRRVYDALFDGWAAVGQVSSFYKKNLATRSTVDPLSDDLISEGLRLSANARKQIATAVGTISAVRFSDTQLAAHSEGLRTDLEDADKTMAALERFFQTYSAANVEVSIRQLRTLDQDLLGTQRDAAAALTRAQAWPNRANVLMNDLIAETEQRNAKQRAFVVKFYATLLASFYLVVFLGVEFRIWQNTWRNDRTTTKQDDEGESQTP